MLREFELPLAGSVLPALHGALWGLQVVLGGKVLAMLLHRFGSSSGSLEAWAHAVQLSLNVLHHAHTPVANLLRAAREHPSSLRVLLQQSPAEAAHLAALPSVLRARGPQAAALDAHELLALLQDWEQAQHALQELHVLASSFLAQCVQHSASAELGMVWTLGGQHTAQANAAFQAAEVAIGGLDSAQLHTLVGGWCAGLEEGSVVQRSMAGLQEQLWAVKALEGQEDSERQARTDGSLQVHPVPKEWGPAKRRKHMLGQTIAPTTSNSVSSHSMDQLQSVRCVLPSELKAAASSLYKALQQAPLCELFLFEDECALQRMVAPQLPVLLVEELLHPCAFLEIQHGGGADQRWPDPCVLLSASQQMGRRINLQDWFDRFCVVGQTESSATEVLQSRFVRGVAEVELLGLVAGCKPGYMDKLFVALL
eukprot:TRINITY_DN45426_c0_g1_i1.p1 TRINITY_DN45426_c0_g1~~TRINITY_DN45426_c0_g1_i1.p1  ORF type:complete len:425 (-),score=166.31 TRINITY_DN45426_c0_g1_i1:17-1291(-)